MAGRAPARSQPTLALTTGDPTGIGPEVLLKSLRATPGSDQPRSIIIGDHAVFEQIARRLRQRLPAWQLVRAGHPVSVNSPLTFLDLHHDRRFIPGRSSSAAGAASLAYLNHALALWRAGIVDGIVTGPVTKWAIHRVHQGFIGQTEYLAQATKTECVVMMFASARLRVVVLTRHVPLARVGKSITPTLLRRTITLTLAALRHQFHLPDPRVAVCGINPHAGESGTCGDEEHRMMGPVMRRLRRRGVRVDGPFAADGLFAESFRRYAAIICAYHDQGLIPFKLLARDQGCQVSLGLPLVRTAPDHGSALDIAGRGIAHPGSMRYAIALAAQLCAG